MICKKIQLIIWRFQEKMLPLHIGYVRNILGLTGFDSRPRWYVSMRSDGCGLHNHVGRTINWRNKVRSRCLIEVQ